MAFAHTPYDGSKQPFTIGAEPLDPARWIEPDDDFLADLALKDEILRTRFDATVQRSGDTRAAEAELQDLFVQELPLHCPQLYRLRDDGLEIIPAGCVIPLDTDQPLVACARLVQEDLCLMRRDERSWRLVAGVLCFPSGWSLAEKIGGDLDAVHGPVPGFPGRMSDMVCRMFDRLVPDRPVVRWNWSVYGDGSRRQEPSEEPAWSRFRPDEALARAHLRIERQTLRRLARSGDIVFTIRIHSDPLTALANHPERLRLVTGLRDQLLALNPEQLAYKGLASVRDDLVAMLTRMGVEA